MPETQRPRGRPELSDTDRKRKVELFVNPTLAAFLNAEEQPDGTERKRIALRRKREAAELLYRADIESRIL